MKIWFASGNLHKKKELAAILKMHGCENELLIPSEAGLEFDPEETESTFYGNALIKAKALYFLLEQRNLLKNGDAVIADDSGICVDALDGRPGVYSARYGGKNISANERNILLLEELGDNPFRTARFTCSMVLMFNPNRFFIAQENCEGEIVKNIDFAKGSGGFGYDPIMYITKLGKTVAELSEDEKNRLSHRGKAGKIISKILLKNET